MQKAAQKAEAAEIKKREKEKEKWEKGKFALKSIVAHIDTKVVELGSIGGRFCFSVCFSLSPLSIIMHYNCLTWLCCLSQVICYQGLRKKVFPSEFHQIQLKSLLCGQ